MIKYAVLDARILIATIRAQTHFPASVDRHCAARGGPERGGGVSAGFCRPGDRPKPHSCLGSAALVNIVAF